MTVERKKAIFFRKETVFLLEHFRILIPELTIQHSSLSEYQCFCLMQLVPVLVKQVAWKTPRQHFKRTGIDMKPEVACQQLVKSIFPVASVNLECQFDL